MNSTNKQGAKKNKKQRYFLYDFVKATGAIPALLWLRPKITYLNEKSPKRVKGGALIASNHISFFDPVVVHCVFWYRRLNCIATKDLFTSKTKEWFFTKMHCIKIDKENFTMRSLHSVINRLNEEKAVVIFPEGTVNREEEHGLKNYKSGAILMAHISGKPIVPMYIAKRERWYERTRVVIGEEIDVRTLCGKIPTTEEIERASKYLYDKEKQMAEFLQKEGGKKER